MRIILYDFSGNPFSLRKGDRFDMLHAESIVGRFHDVSYVPLGNNLRWRVLYLNNVSDKTDTVRLIVTRKIKQTTE
ncbi:MAG: hypothetical protein GTO41_03960 [Burkholderiales bacterium]|nr:hypothetical protein [Burkholderiales bacterium]